MEHNFRNKHGELLDTSYFAAERDDALILIGHGVTGNKDRPVVKNTADYLTKAGFPCLTFSFSGNGESEGRFEDSTISKEVEDLSALVDQLQGPRKLVYIGHSMGGAVGVLFGARDERLTALVTLAGMVETKDFYDREFSDVTPNEGFMWDEEDCPLSQKFKDDLYQIGSTLKAAEQLRTPYLILHGTADDIVLPGDSEAVKERVGKIGTLRMFDGLSHSFTESPEAAPKAIVDFLKDVL